MNSANFSVFLSMHNVLRKIIINFDYYNEMVSAEIEDENVSENSDLSVKQENPALRVDKAGRTLQRILIPDKLMNAIVIGISEEGSTRSAKRLAWSKLLNVKKSYSSMEPFSTIDLHGIDYIIISGGYNTSVNNRLNTIITSLGKNPQIAELKPSIIFAGSILSLEHAKKELALPGIQFSVFGNVLENDTYTDDDSTLKTLHSPASAVQQPASESESAKIKDFSYTEALRKISDVFCMKRDEKVLSVLFTDGYSLLSNAERDARTTVFRNYAIPQEAETLDSGVFKSVFNDLFIEKRTVFDENLLQKDVMPLDSVKETVFFEPNRIIGVSLTEKISFENFVDFVSIPGMTRGTFYFLFDNLGIILAAMTFFISRKDGNHSFLRGFFNTKDIKNGWIFIPYGRYRKGAVAIYIEKLENDRKEDFVLKWGERRIIEINSNSVVEIHTAKGVFLSNNDAESTRKTIGTKESRKTLIFDLREEMHVWK